MSDIVLADGRKVPEKAVKALDKLEEKWPGATLQQARPAIAAAVLKTIEADFGQLLAVATLYISAFQDDELMSLPEKLRLQEIEDIVERHRKKY